MDPVSAAASIAGLVALAGSIIKYAAPFVQNALHPGDGPQALIKELEALAATLEKLQAYLSSRPNNGTTFGDASLLTSSATALETRLTDVLGRLQKTMQSKVRKLAWPISQEHYDAAIVQVRAFGQLVHFALSIDTGSVLARTSENVAELLGSQLDSIKLLNSVNDRLAPLENAVTGQTALLEDMRRNEESTKLLAWLADDSQERKHERGRRGRVDGTGQWYLFDPVFLRWMDSTSNENFLCSLGEMGSGKTTLTSLAIDHLQAHCEGEPATVAYFYCSSEDSHAQTTTTVFSHLLHQILAVPTTTVPQSLLRLREKYSNSSTVPFDDLLNSFRDILQQFDHVYLVFDALDEIGSTEARSSVLNMIKRLGQSSQVRTLVTARPHCEDVNTAFALTPKLAITARDDDIRTFVRSQAIASNILTPEDDTFLSDISNRLVNLAQGMFLLPVLQLKRVLQEPSRGDMEDALEELPQSLNEFLDESINRINRQIPSRSALALRVLSWLCCASRPPRVDELSDLLSLHPEAKRPKQFKYRPSQTMIIDCCQGLIYYDERESTLHLVHLAIRERLLSVGQSVFGSSALKVAARASLLYLLDPAFAGGPQLNTSARARVRLGATASDAVAGHVHRQEGNADGSREHSILLQPDTGIHAQPSGNPIIEAQQMHSVVEIAPRSSSNEIADGEVLPDFLDERSVRMEIRDFLHQHPFFRYAANHWGWHVSSCLVDPAIHDLAMQLLRSQARVARLAQIGRYIQRFRGKYWSLEEAWSTTAIHIACDFDLTPIVCDLIDTGNVPVDSATGIGTTALIKAASADQVAIVRELLKRGADPYKANWYGNPLHCAAESNSVHTLQELLSAGVDPNSISPRGRTAFSCTLDNDCAEAAELLIKYGAWSRELGFRRVSRPHHGMQSIATPFFSQLVRSRATRILSMMVCRGFLDGILFLDALVATSILNDRDHTRDIIDPLLRDRKVWRGFVLDQGLEHLERLTNEGNILLTERSRLREALDTLKAHAEETKAEMPVAMVSGPH